MNDTSDDQRLDRLIAQYIDRLNAGEALDPTEIVAKDPDLGPDVVKELETFLQLAPSAVGASALGTLGDYTLRRQIGRGGMGVVYDAWEGSLDRQVALKVLPPAVAADAKSSTRFIREAQMASSTPTPRVSPIATSSPPI